jgi:hypothetical protein
MQQAQQQQILLQQAQAQAQHHQLNQNQQQQQQHHQQFLLLQQLQKQAQQQQNQHASAAAAAAMARFPSNIDAHLRPPGLRPINFPQNPNPNLQQQNSNSSQQQQQAPTQPQSNPNLQQQNSQQQKSMPMPMRAVNQAEIQMAYQDAWRVCHPDIKKPFSSLEDACERLLPYHVIADYEAEEDDRILDSDTTGQMPSRSQQWDHNIAAKVSEFTGTFEKQALAFNIITRKRSVGEFRAEERLMIEQVLLQDEKRAMLEMRTEMESRERASREAQMRMAMAAKAEQARVDSQAHAELIHGPIRAVALVSQGNNISMNHDMGEQEHVNPEGMMNGWGRDEKEPSEDFLNDEENENDEENSTQDEWREAGDFDLNSR